MCVYMDRECMLYGYILIFLVKGPRNTQQSFNTGYLGSKKLLPKNENKKIEQSFSLFSNYTGNKSILVKLRKSRCTYHIISIIC